jgi:hypothetical protein
VGDQVRRELASRAPTAVIQATQRLDDDVHQRVRLAILAVLTIAVQADFAHRKTRLKVTESNLGRHLHMLEDRRGGSRSRSGPRAAARGPG